MSRRINYAPGDYVCFCVDCDAQFMGHQLAVRCESCAAANEVRCEKCGAGKYDTISIVNATCVSCDQPHPVKIEHNEAECHFCRKHNAAIADRNPQGGDVQQAPSSDESGGADRQSPTPSSQSQTG